MKRFILIMVLFLIGVVSYSQNTTRDKYLDFDDTGFLFTGASTDVITTTDTTWTYTIQKKIRSDVTCIVEMLIDSTGGTANNVAIYLQNKHFPLSTYSTVATVTWDGANDASDGERVSFAPSVSTISFAANTLISLTDTTGLKYYPADTIITTVPIQVATVTASDQVNMGEYWRISIVGADNTLLAAIRWLNFKFLE